MEYKSWNIRKQYIKGSFILFVYLGVILIFALGVFAPKETEHEEYSKVDNKVVEFEGTIGRYPILMTLNLTDIKNSDECEVTGQYCYTASGRGGMLELYGKKSGDNLLLKEYNGNGQQTGVFNGTLKISNKHSSYEYTGIFTNYKEKTFKFVIKSKK